MAFQSEEVGICGQGLPSAFGHTHLDSCLPAVNAAALRPPHALVNADLAWIGLNTFIEESLCKARPLHVARC